MSRRDRHPGAFSLIEVLIAVLVLGIGMLGLAAVFPVVITQQRQASDVILGGVASSAIRDQILANPEVARELLSQDGLVDDGEPDLDGDRAPNDPDDDDPTELGDGEPIFGLHPDFRFGVFNDSDPDFNPRTGFSYLWEADWNWGVSNTNQDVGPLTMPVSDGDENLTQYLADGGLRFRDPEERDRAGLSADDPDLPLSARLYPAPHSNQAAGRLDGPQFVWDFVPRRTPAGAVQLAVFVRRIDTGIRVPDGRTLSDLLVRDADPLMPVGWNEAEEKPSRDGSGQYSVPMTVRAQPVPKSDYPNRPEAVFLDPNDRLVVLIDGVRLTVDSSDEQVSTAAESALRYLGQRGQRFVDNLGVVREVVEVLKTDEDEVDVRVTPAFTISQLWPPFEAATGANESTRESLRRGKLRQAVFTPQIPTDVFVMEFSR